MGNVVRNKRSYVIQVSEVRLLIQNYWIQCSTSLDYHFKMMFSCKRTHVKREEYLPQRVVFFPYHVFP